MKRLFRTLVVLCAVRTAALDARIRVLQLTFALCISSLSSPAFAVLLFGGANLVVNGDAEDSVGASDFSSIVVPSGWTATDNATAVQYDLSDGLLSTDAGPTDPGANYFAGGPASASSSLQQTIDISSAATQLDLGTASFSLSAYLGGYTSQDDNVVLNMTFLDESDVVLESTSIGPVLANERDPLDGSGALTGTALRFSRGVVPTETRSIEMELAFTRTAGSYNDGYADNLSLTLASGVGPGVHIDGREWRQLTDTTNLSWNDFSSVCDADGVCAGDLGDVNFDGWIWASASDVGSLIRALTDYVGPLTPGLTKDSTWAPAFFDPLVGFMPTETTGDIFGARGITRSESRSLRDKAVTFTVEDCLRTECFDTADDSTASFDFASAEYGGWFYRTVSTTEPASVPEPTTTALLTLGLLGAGLGVRRRQRQSH